MTAKTYWRPGEDGEDLPATDTQINETLEMQEERSESFPDVEHAECARGELARRTRAEVSRIMDQLADEVC